MSLDTPGQEDASFCSPGPLFIGVQTGTWTRLPGQRWEWRLPGSVRPAPSTLILLPSTSHLLLSLFLIHYPCILVLVNGLSPVCFDALIGPDLASRTPFMSVPLFFWHIFILFLCVCTSFLFAKHKITDSSLPSLSQPWHQLLLQEALVPFSWGWYLEIKTRRDAGS